MSTTIKPRAPSSRSKTIRRSPRAKRAPQPNTGSPATPPSATRETRYHHGALRDALLTAAETVLERDGLAGLTLRAVAREAGVSHAAPTHHFKDLTGLLSELAAIGFRRFNATMFAAGDVAGTPDMRAMARARAYVAYAQSNPGMYGLMFRTERLDMNQPSLHEAAEASFAGLSGAIAARRHEEIATDSLTLDQAAEIVRAWSLVHGYTMLMLDGRLRDVLDRLPDATTSDDLLKAMLQATMTFGRES